MKKVERVATEKTGIPLTLTQTELILLKRARLQDLLAAAQRVEADYQATLNRIALEVGIPESEMANHVLSEDAKEFRRRVEK